MRDIADKVAPHLLQPAHGREVLQNDEVAGGVTAQKRGDCDAHKLVAAQFNRLCLLGATLLAALPHFDNAVIPDHLRKRLAHGLVGRGAQDLGGGGVDETDAPGFAEDERTIRHMHQDRVQPVSFARAPLACLAVFVDKPVRGLCQPLQFACAALEHVPLEVLRQGPFHHFGEAQLHGSVALARKQHEANEQQRCERDCGRHGNFEAAHLGADHAKGNRPTKHTQQGIRRAHWQRNVERTRIVGPVSTHGAAKAMCDGLANLGRACARAAAIQRRIGCRNACALGRESFHTPVGGAGPARNQRLYGCAVSLLPCFN